MVPESITAEGVTVALDLLFLTQMEWINAGFPLWTRQFDLVGITVGSPEVNTPAGTVDIMHAYWRILMPYRGNCTLSTGAGNTTLFGGQRNADVPIAGPTPSVIVNFTTPTEVDTVGVLLGGSSSVTAALAVQTSLDGITWTTAQTLPSATYAPGAWTYFDLDPYITSQYVRLQNPGSGTWTLNQLNFGLANGQDIELGVLNIDDYYNLPNKQFSSDRPNSLFVDRQVSIPVMKIWPVPNDGAFYNGTVSVLSRRYIQDPGTMRNIVEMPQRWFEAVIARLAARVVSEIPEQTLTGKDAQMTYMKMQQRESLAATLEQKAARAEGLAWAEERTKGPVRLTPSITPYTA